MATRVTHAGVQVLRSGDNGGNTRVTHAGVQVLRSGDAANQRTRVTHVGVMVLRSVTQATAQQAQLLTIVN